MVGPKKLPTAKKKAAGNKKKEELKRKQEEEQEEENEAEFQKAVLEIRVKELETLNTGLTGKCDYLDSQNRVYKTQLEELREEKDDLVNYLQRCLSEEQTITRELEDRLYGMQEARKDDARDFEKKFAQKDDEFDTMKTKLDKTIIEMGMKLAAIEEFRVQKVELTKQREDLIRRLDEERKTFNEKYAELENKTIAYREKLKQDAIATLIKISEDVQKAGKMSLTSAVKAAIAANVKLNQELEIVSKDNLKLRDELGESKSTNRERKMTIKILEEENSTIHKKCLQYKEIVTILLDQQVQMENRIQFVEKIEVEMNKLWNEHAKCKTEEQIRGMLKAEIEAQRKAMPIDHHDSSMELEIRHLRQIIVKMAVVTKDLSQASNPDEFEFLKGRFKTMLIKLYQCACDFEDLPSELKARLIVQLPQVSVVKQFP